MVTPQSRLRISEQEFHSKETLIALYHETCTEIARLRQTEWRIAYYFLTLSIGIIALILDESFQSILNGWLRIALTVVQSGSVILAVSWLRTTHSDLTVHRNIRREIEKLAGFHRREVYAQGAILPESWQGEVSNQFQWRSAVLPIAVAVVLVQMFSVFVLWEVAATDAALGSTNKPSPTDCWT